MGKAGGTDDENAEGGGDTLATVDSDTSADEDESRSNLDSFVVHDTDSEDEAPVARKKLLKKPQKVINLDSDEEDEEADSEEANSESGSDSDASDSESDSEASASESETSEASYNASDLVPSTKIRQLLAILKNFTTAHVLPAARQCGVRTKQIGPFAGRLDKPAVPILILRLMSANRNVGRTRPWSSFQRYALMKSRLCMMPLSVKF